MRAPPVTALALDSISSNALLDMAAAVDARGNHVSFVSARG